MAGRGPVRKPDDQRARRNKDAIPLRVVEVKPSPQPHLPGNIDWHPQVLIWWAIWGDSELAAEFTDVEWNYLAETALLQQEFWNGDMKVASELRLRAAKFGATPEDRARLRIQVVSAVEAEARAEDRANLPSSRSRYAPAPKVG